MRYALTFEPVDMEHGRVEEAYLLDALFRIQPVGAEYMAEVWSRGHLCASENFATRAAAVDACEKAFR